MKKKFVNMIIGVCAVSCAAFAVGGALSVAESSDGWSESTLQSEYTYQSTVSLEKRTYTYNGKEYTASAILCFPDGTRTADSEVVLSEVGTYTVKYTVKAGDKYFADSEDFLVEYPKYFISNTEKSSVSYGVGEGATKKGVVANLAVNDAVTFTQYIDFSSLTESDVLVGGYVVPSVVGTSDFSELILTFTDSEDSSIYFQVHYYSHDTSGDANTYINANANGQKVAGKHQSQGIKKGDTYGLWSHASFRSQRKVNGVNVEIAPDTAGFYVNMNYAEKQLYGPGFVNTEATAGTANLFCDLDDSSYFDSLWEGFPSGKARLSISASGYQSSVATIVITDVYGIDDLENNIYLDTVAPTIAISDEYDGDFPYGEVGYDYTFPAATAVDEYAGACEVNTKVWFNYGTKNAVNVSVSGNKFHMDKEGTYAIVYTAVDAVGNKAEVIKYVNGHASTEAMTIALPEEKTTAADVGALVKIPALKADAVTGGSGKKTIKTYAEYDGAREEVTGSFRAMKTGVYRVVYVATDYIGKTAENYYEVQISVGETATTPVLEEGEEFYPYYLGGAKYSLPVYYAYYYNGTLTRDLCEIVVTDGNGTNTYNAGDTVKIAVKNQGDSIGFAVKSHGKTLKEGTAVGIVAYESDTLKQSNYFYGTHFTSEMTADGLILTASGADGFDVDFANPLPLNSIALSLGSITGATENSVICITLTDALNPENSVSAVIGQTGGTAYLSVDGQQVVLTGMAFTAFDISFVDGVFSVGEKSLTASGVSAFTSKKAFLTLSYKNAAEGASLVVTQVGNMKMNTLRADRYKPVIVSTAENGGTYKAGEKYTLPGLSAYDVMSPNVLFMLSVTNPNGDVVTADDGTLLQNADPTKEYTFSLDVIGKYLVSYTATEDEDFQPRTNTETLSFNVTVADTTKPEFSWNGELQTEAKVGDTIVIPAYTVSDDSTATENLIISYYVETPDSRLMMLPGNSIVVTKAGVYKFRVMVVDEAGNMTNVSFAVNVTENVTE